MTKQIREYMEFLERFFSIEHDTGEFLKMREELLQRIKFYAHERLIHLIVTMSFGVYLLLAMLLYFASSNVGMLILAALLLILLAPYVKHYFFLENSVQKLYTYYYKIEKL